MRFGVLRKSKYIYAFEIKACLSKVPLKTYLLLTKNNNPKNATEVKTNNERIKEFASYQNTSKCYYLILITLMYRVSKLQGALYPDNFYAWYNGRRYLLAVAMGCTRYI